VPARTVMAVARGPRSGGYESAGDGAIYLLSDFRRRHLNAPSGPDHSARRAHSRRPIPVVRRIRVVAGVGVVMPPGGAATLASLWKTVGARLRPVR
jgi:hypothetical protein